jgi:hypothetical protein
MRGAERAPASVAQSLLQYTGQARASKKTLPLAPQARQGALIPPPKIS